MLVPRFFWVRSYSNNLYLRSVDPEDASERNDGTRMKFLRFKSQSVSATNRRLRFEVVPAVKGGRLFHIKSCYNNKYWVRWSSTHKRLVAAADYTEEDESLWSCTLFRADHTDASATSVRFFHIQSRKYLGLTANPVPDCLLLSRYEGEPFEIIDWELATAVLPR